MANGPTMPICAAQVNKADIQIRLTWAQIVLKMGDQIENPLGQKYDFRDY
jgi:hypothetical protein